MCFPQSESILGRVSWILFEYNIEGYGYRDDLESLGYIILNFFVEGRLFQNFSSKITEQMRNILISFKTNLLNDLVASKLPGKRLFFSFHL